MRALFLVVLASVVFLCACTEGDDVFDQPTRVVTASSETDTIPADGVSIVDLEIQVEGPVQASDKVTVTTTDGTLLAPGASGKSITVELNDGGAGAAQLRSSTTVGDALLAASLGDGTAELTIAFSVATPSTIAVDPGAFQLVAGFDSSTKVTARLSREPGQGSPSAGLILEYSARDDLGSPIGVFRDVRPSDNNGESSAMFSAGDAAFRGSAEIVVRYADPGGGVVEGVAQLEIVDPPDPS
ncbi:MAG: hypothetical protein GY725_06095 [bacterium]|nr:hypothetical protein [bacterium]